ncbi:MAG: hypothetical protein WDO16_25760 [Bacteroidota bacterium]
MKSTARPSLYFSAYPLKAIKEPSAANKQPESPYLKALLSGKSKTSSQVRVLPMTNPYKKQFNPPPFKGDKLPKDIELTEKDWFKSYE